MILLIYILFFPHSNARYNVWTPCSCLDIHVEETQCDGPYHDPDGIRHLFQYMWGLRRDWRHATAPEHRVQPGLVDGVKREADVALRVLPKTNHTRSQSRPRVQASSPQHAGFMLLCSYLTSRALAWLYRSSSLPMPCCWSVWGLCLSTEAWIRPGACCLTWALCSSGVHITYRTHDIHPRVQTRRPSRPTHLPGFEESQTAAQPVAYH